MFYDLAEISTLCQDAMAHKRDRSAFELESLIELLMAQGWLVINTSKLRWLTGYTNDAAGVWRRVEEVTEELDGDPKQVRICKGAETTVLLYGQSIQPLSELV
jgi:hypothetical protein